MFKWLKQRREEYREYKAKVEADDVWYSKNCQMMKGDIFIIDDKHYVIVSSDDELEKTKNRGFVSCVAWETWRNRWRPEGHLVRMNAGDMNARGIKYRPRVKTKIAIHFTFPSGEKLCTGYQPENIREYLYDYSAWHLAMYSASNTSLPVYGISRQTGETISASLINCQISTKLMTDDLILERAVQCH